MATSVLVVGTGAAGLRAAIELAERGVQVLCVGKRRRDEERRQIRVWPPAARTTASATISHRLPSPTSNPYEPNTRPSWTSSRVAYTSSRISTPTAAARSTRTRWISRPV